jgi:hypothetical protein
LNDKEFLQHYGVLGMHWGHRKASSTVETHTTSRRTSEDHEKKMSLKGKKVHEMTNAELKAFNERVQLEKQYKQLTKEEMSAGQKFVMDLLANASKEIATQYVKKYASKGLENAMKKLEKSATK